MHSASGVAPVSMTKAFDTPVYRVTGEWANVSSPRLQPLGRTPRVSPHATASVGSPRPPALSPRTLPHLEHQYHFGWTKPNPMLPTTAAAYGNGWAARATDSLSPRAPGETSMKRLAAEAGSTRKLFRAPEPLDPDRFWSPAQTSQTSSPRLGAPRSPRSPRLKRHQDSTPQLQLISWPGHSTFVKRVARPPALNSVAVRRGDYPLMQRQLMEVAGH